MTFRWKLLIFHCFVLTFKYFHYPFCCVFGGLCLGTVNDNVEVVLRYLDKTGLLDSFRLFFFYLLYLSQFENFLLLRREELHRKFLQTKHFSPSLTKMSISPFLSKGFPIGVRQSKIYKCPERSFGSQGVNGDIFDVVRVKWRKTVKQAFSMFYTLLTNQSARSVLSML